MTLPIYPHITSYDSIQISRYYKTFEQTFERNRKSVYAIRPPFEKRNVLLYSHEWESPSQIPRMVSNYRTTETAFLGPHLSQSMNIGQEVSLKFQQVMQTW